MKERTILAFARVCRELASPFAHREAVLSAAGLSEEVFEVLALAWGNHLRKGGAQLERFVAAYQGLTPRGSTSVEREVAPRLSWQVHARLRGCIDREPAAAGRILATEGLEWTSFDVEDAGWREHLGRDPMLRAQWMRVYERARAGG